jgi:hypothetical protein
MLVVPLGKNGLGEVVMLGVTQSEREELRLELFLGEGHLSRSLFTLALMLIFDD